MLLLCFRWQFSQSTALRLMTVSSRFKDRFSFKSSSKDCFSFKSSLKRLILIYSLGSRVKCQPIFAVVSIKHITAIIFAENNTFQHPKYFPLSGDCTVSGWFGGRGRRDGHGSHARCGNHRNAWPSH